MISQSSELGLECSRLVKIPQKIAVPNYFIFFDEDLESDLHMYAMRFTSLTDKDLIKYDWTSCSFSPSLNIQIYIKLKSLLEHFQSCFTLKDKVGLNVFSFCPFDNEDKNVCLYQTDFCVRITVHFLVYVCFVFPSSDILDVF